MAFGALFADSCARGLSCRVSLRLRAFLLCSWHCRSPWSFHRCSSCSGGDMPVVVRQGLGSRRAENCGSPQLWMSLCSYSDMVGSRAQQKCLRFFAPFEDFPVALRLVRTVYCAVFSWVRRDGGRGSITQVMSIISLSDCCIRSCSGHTRT